MYKIRFTVFLIVMLAGSLVLTRQWGLYHSVPKNFEWNAIEDSLRTRGSVQDLLLFEPGWLAGYAQDHSRFSPYSVVTARDIKKDWIPPAPRIWLLSVIPHSPSDRFLKRLGFSAGQTQVLYAVQVTPYERPAKGALFNFSDHVNEANVFINYGEEKIQKARWENSAWVFEGNPMDWNQVGVRAEPFRNQIRRCIWLHPLEAGFKTISFSNVPMGKAIRLVGGITDSGLKTPPGASVILHVRVGGERIETLEFKDTDRSFEHKIPAQKFSGTNRQVDFEVQTSDQGQRHFCFSAWSES